MKFIFYVIAIVLLMVPSVAVEYECDKQCVVLVDSKTQEPTGDLNCTLPSENAKMRIIAEDVFDDYGKLKTYFGTVDTVCEIEN